MARRVDSGWRDESLTVQHDSWGFDAPAPGMTFPMIEYDRGEPLAIINYIRRGLPLPRSIQAAAAYTAFGRLYRETGEQLPFFTVVYDPRNWAYRVFGHNDAAKAFNDSPDWIKMTEAQFARNLYRLRGRYMPQLNQLGVEFATNPWLPDEPDPLAHSGESWPGQLMSERRREFEPVAQTRMKWRNPCLDVDLAVVDRDRRVSLVVDYKAPGARINLASTNAAAMSKLFVTDPLHRSPVPAMIVSYAYYPAGWTFRVHCLNRAAQLHLAYTLGTKFDDMDALASAITGTEWVDLSESQWQDVLRVARDV